jgi:hypothetical protein
MRIWQQYYTTVHDGRSLEKGAAGISLIIFNNSCLFVTACITYFKKPRRHLELIFFSHSHFGGIFQTSRRKKEGTNHKDDVKDI